MGKPTVAIIGKPNVGKSSRVNKLLGEDRVIVSDIAGTTRDAVDTRVKWQGKDYIFIDTAGLRRKGKVKEEIERYSVIRTVTAVERADIVIVMIDASEGVTEQDAKIAGIAHERGKCVIIAVNKWDAIKRMIRLFISTQTESARFWHICHMRSWYLFLQKQDSGFPECLKRSMRLSKTRHCVSRRVS